MFNHFVHVLSCGYTLSIGLRMLPRGEWLMSRLISDVLCLRRKQNITRCRNDMLYFCWFVDCNLEQLCSASAGCDVTFVCREKRSLLFCLAPFYLFIWVLNVINVKSGWLIFICLHLHVTLQLLFMQLCSFLFSNFFYCIDILSKSIKRHTT